jgi:signal transduction histidine kinase
VTRSRDLLVPGAAVLSVATSVVTLLASGRDREPLPVQAINLTVIAAGAAGMAVLLHRRTPENNLWRVLLAIALVGPVAVALLAITRTDPTPPAALVGAIWLVDVPLVVPWLLFVGLFPDGHRPVRHWPVFVWASGALLTAVSLAAWLTAPDGAGYPIPGHLPGAEVEPWPGSSPSLAATAASLLTGLLPLVAVGCLVHRLRRAGPVMRQQILVGAAGLATSVVIEISLLSLPFVDDRPLQLAAAVIAVGAGALGVAAGLLRWRLWVVDQALPRAVVLGACSAAFTAVIAGGALIFTGQVHSTQVRTAVLLALVVTVLLQGYSRRLEPWVRRLVYGEQPGGFAVLVGLADKLVSLDDRSAAACIADSARRGLAVPWAAVWAPTARLDVFRLVIAAGEHPTAETLVLSGADLARAGTGPWLVASPDDPAPLPPDTAAVSFLCSDLLPWGLLATGQRRGEPLTEGDLELLTVITREAELAHANRVLVDEVAVSLDQLRLQALQLQESRQRLVAAQDEERRRMERDLHDGAQHELITLAGRLRLLAGSNAVPPGTLDELAAEAERAVFSLQDLARGIYPSVLTDHGVAAAIRSYAGRLPVTVTLDVSPGVAGRRWPEPLEVALYFVAVESIGNSHKHAAARQTVVTLAAGADEVVLEVHDDGRGFDPRTGSTGSGLQHMADRMAALGGSLVVESRPGAGTWVTARAHPDVPAPRRAPDGQLSVPDSRR